jgi:hypothetical protein
MNVVIILLALSTVTGFDLGPSFSWLAIAISSTALAVLSSALLLVQGFSGVSGIVILSACLTLNQIAYLGGGCARHLRLFDKKINQEPRQRRHNDIANNPHRQKRYPSWFV